MQVVLEVGDREPLEWQRTHDKGGENGIRGVVTCLVGPYTRARSLLCHSPFKGIYDTDDTFSLGLGIYDTDATVACMGLGLPQCDTIAANANRWGLLCVAITSRVGITSDEGASGEGATAVPVSGDDQSGYRGR